MDILADENFPRQAVDALRAAGFDVTWVRTDCPGTLDPDLLVKSSLENRLLITFDKDFGELVFRSGHSASSGVILYRVSLRDVDAAAAFIVRTIQSRQDWNGHFSVADEQRIRMRPLSGGTPNVDPPADLPPP